MIENWSNRALTGHHDTSCQVAGALLSRGSGVRFLTGAPFFSGTCALSSVSAIPSVSVLVPVASLATYYFSRTVLLTMPPTAPATLSVAVDDYAEVWVNGTFVAALGSTTVPAVAGAAQNSFHAIDITAFLLSGPNVITIKAQNGDSSLAGCTGDPIGCTYQQNPAGVIFCGLIPQ